MKEALLLEAPFTEAMYATLHEERLATIAESLQPTGEQLNHIEPRKRENVDDAWRDTRRNERPDLDLVRSRERERIERDLHDDLGGNLSALKMLLDLTWQQMPVTTQLEQRRAQWNQLIDRSIESIHRIATNLRPSALEHGLLAALETLALEQTQQQDIPHHVYHRSQAIEMETTLAIALFRVAQESFNNIRKHASASQVDVFFMVIDDSFVLEIIDNGRGFSIDESFAPGCLGVRGMRERIELLGGQFHLASRPGKGTLVRATLPRDTSSEKTA
jgi:two-component system, NarL family, sensor histidine kinase UhpB